MAEPEITSLWGGLSPHLVASFWQCDKDGKRIEDSPTVKTALTEANLDITLNWQSAFEQAGPESKAPTLLAMLQSGTLQPLVDSLMTGKSAQSAQNKSSEFLKQFEGKTGITRLNSTQVFNGLPPLKFQVTALFRAWRDTASEVEIPLNQLMAWALPQELARDSTLLSRGVDAARGNTGFIDALLPSKAPAMVAMKYKNRTYAPLVIESIGVPLSSPIDANGNFVELSLPMTIATLASIDKTDWANFSKVQ
jgi:hypothetical protein